LTDLAAAAQEEPEDGTGRSRFRVVRLIGTLIVILALLLYFIAPFNNAFRSVPYRWFRPDSGTRPIPLAPVPKSNPKLHA